MASQYIIPVQYKKAFIDAGWYENRKIGISDYIFELEWSGYNNLEHIKKIMTEFGGLEIHNPQSDKYNSAYGINFILESPGYKASYFSEHSKASGEQIIPLATGLSDVDFLISDKGTYFGYCDHYLWKLGNTFSEFIIAVFEGENWHRIQFTPVQNKLKIRS